MGVRVGASLRALPSRGDCSPQAWSPSGTDLHTEGSLANWSGVSFRATPMRVVLAMTPMGLDHDDIAALKGLATHRTKEIVQAFHPTLPERTEPRFGMLIKWCAQELRHGKATMTIDDPVMAHLTHLSDPIVAIALGTS